MDGPTDTAPQAGALTGSLRNETKLATAPIVDMPPIEREVLNLDKALNETADALSCLYEQVDRLEGRIGPALGPHRPSEISPDRDQTGPNERSQSRLASELEERVVQLIRLAAGVRDGAHRIESLIERVEL